MNYYLYVVLFVFCLDIFSIFATMINHINKAFVKNKGLIIMLLGLLVFFPVLVKNASAQTNIVATNTTMSSRTSIVREYTSNLFLVYNNEGSGNTSFNLIDMSTGFCQTMYLQGMTVNDFEIVDRTAYFCGANGTNVVAGWFDINALFYSVGVISSVNIPTPLSCAICSLCSERILSVE